MKLKVDVILKDFKGNDLKEGETPVNLKNIITGALLMPEENVSGQKKADRYFLAQRVENSGDKADLKAEEISEIKELIGKFYAPIIVGQAYEILEGK